MTEDAELLRRYAAERSEAAFVELVSRHLNFVYSAALRMTNGDVHLAHDVTQAVFTDVARKAHALASHRVLTGWLYTSTRFAAANAIRGERRRQVREQQAHAMNELSQDSTGAAVEWERLRPEIDQALQALNERDREAVLLRFFAGESFPDIGARLSLTADAARLRVERALVKMRAVLARRGLDSTTAALAIALATQPATAVPAGVATTVTGAALAATATCSAGAAAAGFGLLSIMSTTKITVALGVLALAATGVAILQTVRAHRFESSHQAAQRELEAIAETARVLERQLHASTARVQPNETQAGIAPSSPPVAPANVGAAMSRADYILAHPELRPFFLKQEALLTKMRYARFFQSAGLTPAQQEEFVKAMVEATDVRWDGATKMRAAEAAASTPEESREIVAAMHKETHAKMSRVLETGLRAALGENVDALRNFPVQERVLIEQLAAQVFDTPTPLTPEQARRLEDILVQNRFRRGKPRESDLVAGGVAISNRAVQRVQQQTNAQYGDLMEWFRPISDTMIEQARRVLTPPQVTALRNLQMQQLIQFEIAEAELRRASGKG